MDSNGLKNVLLAMFIGFFIIAGSVGSCMYVRPKYKVY